MLSCTLKGGLGNQMFQIAATFALAWDNQDFCVFGNSHTPNQGNDAFSYKDNILYRVRLTKQLPKLDNKYQERSFLYNPIWYQKEMMLNGYFQSPKYFDKYQKEIQSLFILPLEIKRLRSIYKKYLRNSVSVHIRRGDYIGNENTKPLDLDYYRKALDLYGPIGNLFVFSDDIEWAKANIVGCCRTHYLDSMPDWECLYLMSLCKHNIIANSSFSWWGAYLNNYSKKKVVAPKEWFVEDSVLDSKDIYTSNMILL
jgi:hypothetical protein